MKLEAAANLRMHCSGTSEGAEKGWDTRGRLPTAHQALLNKGFTYSYDKLEKRHVYNSDKLGSVFYNPAWPDKNGNIWHHNGATDWAKFETIGGKGKTDKGLEQYIAQGKLEKNMRVPDPKDKWAKLLDKPGDSVPVYHVTHVDNADSIAKNGLNVGSDTKTVSLVADKPTARTAQEWTALWMRTNGGKDAVVVRADVPKSMFKEMMNNRESDPYSGELAHSAPIPAKYITSIKHL